MEKAWNVVSRIAFDSGSIATHFAGGLAYEAAKSLGLAAQVAHPSIRRVAAQYAALRSNGVAPLRLRFSSIF